MIENQQHMIHALGLDNIDTTEVLSILVSFYLQYITPILKTQHSAEVAVKM